MTQPSKNLIEGNASCALFLLAQAALGCGLGLLVANKLDRSGRQTASIASLAVGVAAALPFLVDVFAKSLNRPQSDRAMRRKLRSIRDGAGFHTDEELQHY